MVLSLAAAVLVIVAWVDGEIEYPDVKYCPVVKPCYTSLLYDVQYRCAQDIVCPVGYKCCRSDCYIHKVCVVAVNKNGEKIPPPTVVTDDPITTSIPTETEITSTKENDITSQGPVGSELTSGIIAVTDTTSLNEATEVLVTTTSVESTTSTATITSTIISSEATEGEEFQRVTTQATTVDGDATISNEESFSTLQIATGSEKLSSITDSIDTESSEIFTTEDYTTLKEEIYSTVNTEIETETENLTNDISTPYLEVFTTEDRTTIMAGTIDTTSITNLDLTYNTSTTDETTLYTDSTTATENNSVNDVSTVTLIAASSDEDVTAVDGSGNSYINIDEEDDDFEGSGGGTIATSEDDEIVFPSDDELTTKRINQEHTTVRKTDENGDFEIEFFSTTDQTTNFEVSETVTKLTTVSSYVSTTNKITEKEQGTVTSTIDDTSDFEGSGNTDSDTIAPTSSVTETSFSQAIGDDEDYSMEGSGDTTNSVATESDDDKIIFPGSYRITSAKEVNDQSTTLKSSEDFELELSMGTEEANLNLESSVEEYNSITLIGTTTKKSKNNIQTNINEEVGSVTGTTSISIDKEGSVNDTVPKEATTVTETAEEKATPGSLQNDLIDNEPGDIEDEPTTYSPIPEVYSHRRNILQKETPLSNTSTKTINSVVVNREEEEEDDDDEDGVDDDIRNNFQTRITSG